MLMSIAHWYAISNASPGRDNVCLANHFRLRCVTMYRDNRSEKKNLSLNATCARITAGSH